MQKLSIKPERTDGFFMKEILNMAFNARIGMILMTVVVVLLIVVIFSLISRPAQMVVIDRGTGQSFAPVGLVSGVTQELLDRQLVYYTAQTVENYFNYDHRMIIQARQSVFELAGSQFRATLGDKFAHEENVDVRGAVGEQARSVIQWEMHPRVTMRNDPHYTVFVTFQRFIIIGEITREVKRYNVRVDWGRLNNNVDYIRRPHSLVLMDIKILNEGSVELNEQINKIR